MEKKVTKRILQLSHWTMTKTGEILNIFPKEVDFMSTMTGIVKKSKRQLRK
jgi:hypothetical protein